MLNDKTKKKLESLDKTENKKVSKGRDYIDDSRKKITKIIESLIIPANKFEPENVIVEIQNYLANNYTKGRIIYSEISSLIFGFSDDQIGCLLTNAEKLLTYAMEKKDLDADCHKIIIKLYDHCNLANNQKLMSFSPQNAIEEFITKKVKESKDTIDNEVKSFQIESKEKMDDFEKELKSKEKQYISILGIFASIVLAFVGGLAFSTSVLQNIHLASIYRLLMVVDILALVLTNIIYLLVQFICKINEKTLKFFPIKIFNIIAFVFMGVVIIAWILSASSLPEFVRQVLPW